MTRKEINMIAAALKNARGQFPTRDERSMWESCVNEVIAALEHMPNFDRVPFQIAAGIPPVMRVGEGKHDQFMAKVRS